MRQRYIFLRYCFILVIRIPVTRFHCQFCPQDFCLTKTLNLIS